MKEQLVEGGDSGGHQETSRVVHAAPTKSFFVNMLVRDIELMDAVIDLLDNSVDGARRIRPDGNYEGLWVKIRFDSERFEIEDNCGGMPLDIARDYAFRFGRDEGRPATPHTIGQFGVGMKRTLFKLGRRFMVESRTVADSFLLDVNVDDWQRNPAWDFLLEEANEGEDRTESDTGTTISVYNLIEGVQSDLTQPTWLTRLSAEARLKHRRALDRKMQIIIRGSPLEPMPLDLIEDEHIKPVLEVHQYFSGERAVNLRLLAGVSETMPAAAGWYVFCNDRLVLGPDKTDTTVWLGGGRQARGSIPRYHDQYARFRGYAFFDADDPAMLPWTTTKTGIDADSSVWRDARLRMIRVTRPVIDFLNELDKERTAVRGDARTGQPGVSDDAEITADLAEKTVRESKRVSIDNVVGAAAFQRPRVDLASLPAPMVWIRYSRDASEVSRVRRLMGGRTDRDLSNGEIGARTFDYYLRNEDEN